VRLDEVRVDMIERLLEEAWRRQAPKSLARRDSQEPKRGKTRSTRTK